MIRAIHIEGLDIEVTNKGFYTMILFFEDGFYAVLEMQGNISGNVCDIIEESLERAEQFFSQN